MGVLFKIAITSLIALVSATWVTSAAGPVAAASHPATTPVALVASPEGSRPGPAALASTIDTIPAALPVSAERAPDPTATPVDLPTEAAVPTAVPALHPVDPTVAPPTSASAPSPAAASPSAHATPVLPAPVAALPALPVALVPPPSPTPSAPLVIGSAQQALINADRAAAGLGPLNWSNCLVGVAQENAQRIADQGSLSHTSGAMKSLECQPDAVQGGENIGWWSAGIDDNQLNTMFMNSPEHKANIMGPYHWVGTFWVTSSNGSGCFAGGCGYIAVEFA